LNLSPTREEEIVEELSQDLQERFEEAVSHGASEDEAKQLALNELTFPESIDNELKRVEQPVRSTELAIGAKKRGNQFAGFWDDIRFGLRMLRKQPGFAVVVILTLGIGIGATTAMAGADVLIRPLPYAHSDRLYAIWASSESTGQTHVAASGPDFEDYLDQSRSFAHLAEYIPRFTFTWTGDGEPKLVTCTSVSEDFFPMFGIRPYLGRLYESREYLSRKRCLIVPTISGRTSSVEIRAIGRVVHFEGVAETIIGVLPDA
jgi:hypothetical protein